MRKACLDVPLLLAMRGEVYRVACSDGHPITALRSVWWHHRSALERIWLSERQAQADATIYRNYVRFRFLSCQNCEHDLYQDK